MSCDVINPTAAPSSYGGVITILHTTHAHTHTRTHAHTHTRTHAHTHTRTHAHTHTRTHAHTHTRTHAHTHTRTHAHTHTRTHACVAHRTRSLRSVDSTQTNDARSTADDVQITISANQSDSNIASEDTPEYRTPFNWTHTCYAMQLQISSLARRPGRSCSPKCD